MTNWLQRLETLWSRRHLRGAEGPLPEDAGRKPVCVITGGSEGIGRHLANEFAARGHALLLVARTVARLEAAAAELRRDHGAEVHVAAVDLTLPDAAAAIGKALDRHRLYADILVNNAAFGLGGAFAGQKAETILALCRLNIEALTMLTRAFLPAMLLRGRGGILNIASLGGYTPGPYQAVYYASKAYVVSFTEALAYENAGRGVRISAAAPGPVATRFHERMGVGKALYLKLAMMPPEMAARIIHSGFIGRRTIIVPGLMPSFNAFWTQVIPHRFLTPLVGTILKRRY
ncbi:MULTISPECIES: SDR family NAD(P)-dependent oxidoreductase [Rhodomicrobium]|uniref:SDR family NAD(P)-dependent oxidoreductase n=1 Tax=Rhodomicrobium TaxID=1068 RepID=UPI000B4ADEAD|nr:MULTISPECIES: SDR family NAD(P)-dependent oxidoreductase [Rhodomicrobium]